MPRILSFEEARDRYTEKFPGKTLVSFERTTRPCVIYCDKHGEQQAGPYYGVMQSKHGCPVCGAEAAGEKISKFWTDARSQSSESVPSQSTALHLYDVAASCGAGRVNPEFPELLRTLEIPNDSLMELLGTTNLKGVELMSPDGDSMEPTIPRKSVTLIKTNVNQFENSGVYLITFDGYTYIKRLSRGKHGVIKVTSDNPVYQHSDFEIQPEECDQLHVHGKLWKALPLDFLDI